MELLESGWAQLEIEIQVSPREDFKSRVIGKLGWMKAVGIGVQAGNDQPTSTNVSSHIDARCQNERAK